MKLAISNIAWPCEQDEAVANVLRKWEVTGIEIAPTKLWSHPLSADEAEIIESRKKWEEHGVRIIAAQSLLFGHPELSLFDVDVIRERTLAYLRKVIALCSRLGVEALVYGSPKSRRLGTLSKLQAWPIALSFFGELADEAEMFNTTIVLEANPPEYGADFVVNASEAIELVSNLNHPGLKLHLDTACMTLANDPIPETFDVGFPFLRHFHVSEPDLAFPESSGRVDHQSYAAELKKRGYSHWVSLEMREVVPFDLDQFACAVQWLKRTYG